MTYDVQRWSEAWMRRDPDGLYVLAADAEAHEKAAVEQAIIHTDKRLYDRGVKRGREQAIKECIALVLNSTTLTSVYPWAQARSVELMRSLLEGETVSDREQKQQSETNRSKE